MLNIGSGNGSSSRDTVPCTTTLRQASEWVCHSWLTLVWRSQILIDFGKATTIQEGKRYHLSWTEQAEHTRRYPHLVPELIEGITKRTQRTDLFSVGRILQHIIDADFFTWFTLCKQQLTGKLAADCCLPNFYSRPTAQGALNTLEELMNSF